MDRNPRNLDLELRTQDPGSETQDTNPRPRTKDLEIRTVD